MVTNNIVSALSSIKIFQNLTEKELVTLSDVCLKRQYHRGDYIFMQSEPIAHVYLQVSGRVRLFSTNEAGSDQTFMIAEDKELFPHVGFFRTGNYPYHAMVLQDCEVVAIAIESFNQLLMTYPSIHFKMTQVLADKILELQRRLEDKTFYTVEGQLISLLLRLATPSRCALHAEEWCLIAPLTNSEIAGLLGTTRETVNRIINKLKKHCAVNVRHDGRMQICAERLREMLPSKPEERTNFEKLPAIKHFSNQCCVSGGHEI